MLFHMKTTLTIDDSVFARLKREAVREGKTMSELVEAALRLLLEREERPHELPPLPELSSGGAFVDVSNRGQMYEAMEGR